MGGLVGENQLLRVEQTRLEVLSQPGLQSNTLPQNIKKQEINIYHLPSYLVSETMRMKDLNLKIAGCVKQ